MQALLRSVPSFHIGNHAVIERVVHSGGSGQAREGFRSKQFFGIAADGAHDLEQKLAVWRLCLTDDISPCVRGRCSNFFSNLFKVQATLLFKL